MIPAAFLCSRPKSTPQGGWHQYFLSTREEDEPQRHNSPVLCHMLMIKADGEFESLEGLTHPIVHGDPVSRGFGVKHLALKISSPVILLIRSHLFPDVTAAGVARLSCLPYSPRDSVPAPWCVGSRGPARCPCFAPWRDRRSHRTSATRWMVLRLISFTAELLLTLSRRAGLGVV